MTAPAGNTTNMTAPTPRLVKIRALKPIRTAEGVHLEPGQVGEVTEEWAKEFCDRKFRGSYRFSGERRGSKEDLDLCVTVRAERVK